MRRTRLVTIAATTILFILHNNWWSWQPDLTMVFGKIPVDIVYRVLWVVAGTGVLWLAIRAWWGPSNE